MSVAKENIKWVVVLEEKLAGYPALGLRLLIRSLD